MIIGVYAAPQSSADTNDPIKSVTAITEVFGEGQKVTAVAVEYDQDIDNAKLSKSAFAVEGRTITQVYANTAAARAAQGANGNYVIIELSPADANALLSWFKILEQRPQPAIRIREHPRPMVHRLLQVGAVREGCQLPDKK